MPANHHQQPRLDGLLLVKDFMELTFGVSAFWGRAGGRADLWRGVIFLKWRHDGTVPVGVGAAHVAPLMRGDLAGPQMKQSGAASTSFYSRQVESRAPARVPERGRAGVRVAKPTPATRIFPQSNGAVISLVRPYVALTRFLFATPWLSLFSEELSDGQDCERLSPVRPTGGGNDHSPSISP
ncbi:hypothetical protein THAOC_36069, partial [Thalassiosira oceanica]